MNTNIEKRFAEVERLLRRTLSSSKESIEQAASFIASCYQDRHGIFTFGNGGSAADAVHIAGELNGRFLKERRALKAQALVCDPAVITSIANDYGYEHIFSRQLEANAEEGDVAFALSTSGSSPNIVKALKSAKNIGMYRILITGNTRNIEAASYSNVIIRIPSSFTPHIQTVSQVVYHCICEEVERILTNNSLHTLDDTEAYR